MAACSLAGRGAYRRRSVDLARAPDLSGDAKRPAFPNTKSWSFDLGFDRIRFGPGQLLVSILRGDANTAMEKRFRRPPRFVRLAT